MKKQLLVIPILVLSAVALFLLNGKDTKPQMHESRPLYVALGDSISAGAGLESSSDSSACDRHNESYPSLVAESLNMKLTSYACSGATANNGIMGAQLVNSLSVKPQLDQLFAGPKPTLITLTIGANDIGWTDILARCVAVYCGSDSDTIQVNTNLKNVTASVKTALQSIVMNYSLATPTVMVTSYYHVFASSNDCTAIPGITATEQAWWNAQSDKLDQALADASSSYRFSNFTPINFSGHELCSSTSWIQGLQQRAPFHPNDEGQKTIADTIVRTYEVLQKYSPRKSNTLVLAR